MPFLNAVTALKILLATRAKQQEKGYSLINFSIGIETFDLSGSLVLSELLNFLKMSFHLLLSSYTKNLSNQQALAKTYSYILLI